MPSSPHNLAVYGYIVRMYVYLDRLFSWSSNTLVKLSMPAWPTFMWVMNDSKPIFQSEIKMLSHTAIIWRRDYEKISGMQTEALLTEGPFIKDVCIFFRFFDPPQPMSVNCKKFDPPPYHPPPNRGHVTSYAQEFTWLALSFHWNVSISILNLFVV